ncbi:MAG: chromate efflux transporter [Cytophagales bacterium]|nr:chromate efflux transporter [Cytophagales bacterium]MDW8383817.1 chromate efflux transporter [Flammeovirgaceae bacterium]
MAIFKKKKKIPLTAREYVFLRNVLLIAITAFGGPQAHMAMFFKVFVDKQRYLTKEELLELYSLCQILPGPTSTQTITAIGFRKGGAKLAYLTILLWSLPAVIFMTVLGILVNYLAEAGFSKDFTRYIRPMAVSFVAFAAFRMLKVLQTHLAMGLAAVAIILGLLISSPYLFPVVLISAGIIAGIVRKFPHEPLKPFKVEWDNLFLYGAVFIGSALLGWITKSLPIRLFENFYRNGSLVFGGGHVLAPMLFTEFVEFKRYLTAHEFMTGYSIVQSLPGPLFSFAAYIGALSMREYGIVGEVIGAVMSSLGIFLPGTFLIFFFIRFWDELKKYSKVRASLEGITAAGAGFVVSAAFHLFVSIDWNIANLSIVIIVFVGQFFEKIPSVLFVLIGIIAGFIF